MILLKVLLFFTVWKTDCSSFSVFLLPPPHLLLLHHHHFPPCLRFKVSPPDSPAPFAGSPHDIIVHYILFVLAFLSETTKTEATAVPVTTFVDSTIRNADAIFEQAKQDVLQFSSNVTLENVLYNAGSCQELENDAKDIIAYFQNYHANNYRITVGPTCLNNFLRFANLTAEIQALQINILIGYPYDHPTMIDMVTRSPQNLAENLIAVSRGFEWQQVGVVLCDECYADDILASESYFETVEDIFELNNIAIKEILKLGKSAKREKIAEQIEVFQPIARVIFLFLGNNINDYVEFLAAMALKNYTTEEYTPVVVMSKYSPEELKFPFETDAAMLDIWERTLIIYNNWYPQPKIASFLSKHTFSSVDETVISLQMYESYHLLGYYLSTATTDAKLFNYIQPEKAIAAMNIEGPFGPIHINTNGQRLAGYDVLVVRRDNSTNNILLLGQVSADKKCPNLACLSFEVNSTLHFEPPKGLPLCGFHGEICDQTGVIYAILIVLFVTVIFILCYLGIRKIIANSKKRSISNPWLIPFIDLKFIDLTNTEGSQHMSIHSLQKNGDEKPRLRNLANTKQIATLDQNYVLVDKFVMRDKIRFDRSDANLLYQIKANITHENLNTFCGVSFDKSSHIYIIWTQCFRGSLHDYIFKKEHVRGTAGSFEAAFLRDILKGIEYLHTSVIGFHGNLTLHTCMLDSHWIVKLSGFGTNRFLVKWKASGQIFSEDHTPIIKSEELHYFDPAIKKIWKSYTGSKQDDAIISKDFGKKCDMYGFGVCLYEIYFKKKFVPELEDTPSGDEDSVLIDEANDVIASKFPLPIQVPEGIFIHNDLLKMLNDCFGSTRPDVTLARKVCDTVLKISGSLVDLMLKNLSAYTQGLTATVNQRTKQLETEQAKNEQLLAELLPRSIAESLKIGIEVTAQKYDSATILYSDIVGFTSLCSESLPIEVVTLLSGMYVRFDLIINQQNGYKMETIGDAYCVAAGLPEPSQTEHVRSISRIAILQRTVLHEFEIPHRPGKYLNCRWGFNTGEVFAGVIGQRAPRYACFGETVALASKMESGGQADKIQMTLGSQQLLEDYYPEFIVAPRGANNVDGYGHLLSYWLVGANEEEQKTLEEFMIEIRDELKKIKKTNDSKEQDTSAPEASQYLQPKDKMTLAREKVLAERLEEERRLKAEQTIHEALKEPEVELELKEILRDEDDSRASNLDSPISEEIEILEDRPPVKKIGHGREDSQASTIPET